MIGRRANKTGEYRRSTQGIISKVSVGATAISAPRTTTTGFTNALAKFRQERTDSAGGSPSTSLCLFSDQHALDLVIPKEQVVPVVTGTSQ
jgi:hypothetical protein